MLWTDMCQCHQFQGRWVALDNVRYDPVTSHPIEADIVDADEDLADLCGRMRESDRTSCAILFCDDEVRASSGRLSSPPPRAMHH